MVHGMCMTSDGILGYLWKSADPVDVLIATYWATGPFSIMSPSPGGELWDWSDGKIRRWSNGWIMDRSPAQMPHASKPGRLWCLWWPMVAFYWSVLVLSSAIFGLTWPINFMIFVGLAMSVAARCSLNHLLPSYARQIQRPVVLLLSSLFSTAGHCLRLRIPIWLPTATVLSGTQTSIAVEMLWGKHWQWVVKSHVQPSSTW